ncbi:MAG: hypothetical protein ABL961_16795 [Vicinamibacterales bacterium]
MMSPVPRRATVSVAFLAIALMAACGTPQTPAPKTGDAEQGLPAPSAANLYADMKPVVSVKELMYDLLDPLADNLFDAVSSVNTGKASVETVPTTEEDWDKIRIGATAMVEGAYLLRIKRPFAPPGDLNNSTGPEPIELSPAQIQEKVDKDPVLWIAKIEALRNVGLQALDVVKRRDVKALWDVSNDLDEACENCHLEYWYPNQKALLDRLDQKLRDLYGKPGQSGAGK